MNDLTKAIKGFCIRKLSLRDYFSSELKNLILKRFEGVSSDTITFILGELTTAKLLDDQRAVAGLARKMLQSGRGYFYFLNKLKLAGVSQEIIRNASDYYSPAEEKKLASQLIHKFSKSAKLDQATKAKLFRKLKSRGFRSGAISSLFDYQSSVWENHP